MMKTAKCSKCGVELNLDAIGQSLDQWNMDHQTKMQCTGKVESR